MNCLGTKHLDLTTESADAVRIPGATASSSVRSRARGLRGNRPVQRDAAGGSPGKTEKIEP
jgi:hypothetical protein